MINWISGAFLSAFIDTNTILQEYSQFSANNHDVSQVWIFGIC